MRQPTRPKEKSRLKLRTALVYSTQARAVLLPAGWEHRPTRGCVTGQSVAAGFTITARPERIMRVDTF